MTEPTSRSIRDAAGVLHIERHGLEALCGDRCDVHVIGATERLGVWCRACLDAALAITARRLTI